MKIILVSLLSLATLLSACATKQLKPLPPPPFNRLDKLSDIRPLSEAETLAKAYLEGMEIEKSQKAKACQLFKDLADSENFPIKDAALIHTLINCDYSAWKLKRIWKNQTIPQYIKEPFLQISLKLAIEHELPEDIARFSYELIPFEKTQNGKLKLIKKSLSIAEASKNDELIKKYKEKLEEIAPHLKENITNQNIYAVAKDFESIRNFKKARSLYEQIIQNNFPLNEKVKAYNSYRLSFKVERDLKSFLEKTFEMEAFLKTEQEKSPDDKKITEAWVDAKIALARAVWTEHQNAKARDILDELIHSELGTINQQATAQFVYASLHIENKEYKEALNRLDKVVDLKITDNALLENIQWSILWNKYLLKKDKALALDADEFIKKSTNPNFIAKLKYWKAKSYLRTKKTKEALSLLNDVFTSDSFGYYGLLASIDLDKALEPLPHSQPEKINSGNITLDWLMAMNEIDMSQRYLKEINSDFKTFAQREKAMPLYYHTQWYQGGMRQIYNFKVTSRNDLTLKYSDIIFPMAYSAEVELAEKKYQIPKELIWAIIRQESAFVPNERSWADAFGLMQLIPEKAPLFSKKFKISYNDYNDLYIPAINIEMGTALLSELSTKFKGKFAQTVASYNASEKAIAVWEKERFNGDYFEFIEMIPYEETRNYIKLVFRNYITYKRLSAKEKFKINKNFFADSFVNSFSSYQQVPQN